MSQHAIENAQSWFQSIRGMVGAYHREQDSSDGTEDDAREAIFESPLSVHVRSGWYSPGAGDADMKPAEYEILLSTGGPALRIIGDLSEHGEPETASLQWQDWGTPWTGVRYSELLLHQPSEITPLKSDEILLAYASVFYFGE